MGCHAPDAADAVKRAAITNGTVDTGDAAVVMIVGSGGLWTGGGAVIGAHTILTAAHCFAAGGFFDDYAVAQIAGRDQLDAVRILRVDPSFDATTFENDLALLTLREAAPVAPLALDSRALDDSWVAQTFTVVGFGSTGGSGDDSGSKRSSTAPK